MAWVVTGVGVVVILLTLRDVFHTLWHPAGQGTLSSVVMRGIWHVTGRRHPAGRARALAGPVSLLTVMVLWAGLLLLGWALVYAPHMPDAFSYDLGLEPRDRPAWLDGLYLSLVTLATLGYGDIVPEAPWLLLTSPIQALIGFALLTAAVSWVLQVYPALSRRRALALRATVVHEAAMSGPDDQETFPVPSGVLEALAADLATVRVDLTQYPETYYFLDPSTETSLSQAVTRLERLAELCRHAAEAEGRWACVVLERSLDDLARTLDQAFLDSDGTTSEVLDAYAADHGHDRSELAGRPPAAPSG